jgi:hypothetical protein
MTSVRETAELAPSSAFYLKTLTLYLIPLTSVGTPRARISRRSPRVLGPGGVRKKKGSARVLSISDTVELVERHRWCACGAEVPYRRAKSCAACSRASSQRHYQGKRAEILRRHHAQKGLLTPVQLQERRDRAYLHTYVKRGRVVPERCRCGEQRVSPIQPELGRLVVVWACRACKPRVLAELQGELITAPPPIRQPRKERAAARATTWVATYENVESELARWPADRATALRQAASTLKGMRLHPESALYRMQLVALYKKVVAQWAAVTPP